MDYDKARKTRQKKFSGLMTDKVIKGDTFVSAFSKTISEKTKANIIGLKEKADPLNIAKSLTGGRLAPALLGRMTGRTPEDIQRVAGDPRQKLLDAGSASGLNEETANSLVESLGNIYQLLVKDRENREQLQQDKEDLQKQEEKNDILIHEELIKALTTRRKKEKPKKVPKAKEEPPVTPKKEPEVPKPPTKKAPKVEKAPKPEVKPPTAKPEAPVAKPPAPPTAAKVPPVVVSGGKGLVLSALVAAGYSKQAQANVMANVEKESNFQPRSEELEKYSAKTLYKLYGPPGVEGGQPEGGKNKVRFQTMSEAQAVVSKGPEAIGEVIYGGRMGNDKPGDGYKYRGRGFIQITGKENYDKIGKMIGVDLVNNPDLANDPQIAAKIIPAYFKLKIKRPEDLDNIDKVNQAVGSASEKSKEQRKSLATSYMTELNTGNQIDSASTENRELKKDISSKSQSNTVVNNNVLNTKQTSTSSTPQFDFDDRPIYVKKALQ